MDLCKLKNGRFTLAGKLIRNSVFAGHSVSSTNRQSTSPPSSHAAFFSSSSLSPLNVYGTKEFPNVLNHNFNTNTLIFSPPSSLLKKPFQVSSRNFVQHNTGWPRIANDASRHSVDWIKRQITDRYVIKAQQVIGIGCLGFWVFKV